MSSITPNMTLTIPDVGVTPDPIWASEVVAAFEDIDAHDHTSGQGVQVPTAGLNINADLSFSSYNATNIRSVRLDSQAAALALATDRNIVYTVNGDLYYNNSSGTAIALTTGGSIAGVTGSISGLTAPASAAYSGDTFIWKYGAGNKFAKMQNGWIEIHPYDGATEYPLFIRLQADTALGASLDITLPTSLPSVTVPMNISATGAIGHVGSGSVGTPAYNFSTETDCGLYISGTNQVSMAAAGAEVMQWTSSYVAFLQRSRFDRGTLASPSLTFVEDTNTGFYIPGGDSDVLNVAAGGTQIASFAATYAAFLNAARFDRGTAAAPSITFSEDTDTGFYKTAADSNTLSLSLAGTARFHWSDSQVLGPDGSVGSPAYSFSSETGLGWYRSGAASITAAVSGAGKFSVTSSLVLPLVVVAATSGTNLDPGYSFAGDLDTGIYRPGANAVALTAGGVEVLRGETTYLLAPVQVRSNFAGTAADPNYSLGTDTDTGLFFSGGNVVGLSAGATAAITASTTTVTAGLPIRAVDGTVSAPAYSFTNGTDVGLYLSGTSELSVATAGLQRLKFLSNGRIFFGPSTSGSAADPLIALNDAETGFYRGATGTLSFAAAATNVGNWSTLGLEVKTPVYMTGSGGTAVAHKTTLVTGTIAPGATASVFSGATVYGVYGWAQVNGSSIYSAIGGNDAAIADTAMVCWEAGTSTSVSIKNLGIGTSAYRVFIIHA